MKTILFDNIIYSLQHVGGISSQWAMLQNGLLHNSEVNLLFLERKDAVNNLYRKSIDVPCEKIVEPVCKYPLIIDRYRNVDVNNIDLDIFHSSYYRCANSKDVRSVVTVHDFTYERFMTGLRRNVHCKQKYNAIIKAEVVVCVSENTKRDLLYYLPETNKNKVRVIHNGVSDDFHKIEGALRGDRLVYVGSRAKYKNFEFVVETLSETSYHLDICGAPLSSREQRYLNRKLGKDRYKLYSNLNNKGLNELYNNARCLIYPSSYEGFGLPIIEAQRAGCPVIALNKSSIPEVIGETPLLLKSLNRNELLLALEMIESPTLFEEISEIGRENSLRFTSQAMMDRYRKVYKEI